MNEKQLRELITRIVREMLAEQPRQETPATGKPNALVLFSGALLGFDAALESQIGRAHAELQSPTHLVCRLLLEKKKR